MRSVGRIRSVVKAFEHALFLCAENSHTSTSMYIWHSVLGSQHFRNESNFKVLLLVVSGLCGLFGLRRMINGRTAVLVVKDHE